jgi:antitoxin (DNA-binding transcriptional repressor) of toxin-antitoxin stability system
MRPVDIREARRNFDELVEAAERGQSVLITRHGKGMAGMEPIRPAQGKPLPDLGAFRESIRDAIQGQGEPLSQVVAKERRRSR